MLQSTETFDAAAVMDRQYRYQRHIYDLTRKGYLLGRDRMIGRLSPPPGGTVLEIGCGTGRNLVKIARRYPNARLFGLDISDQMLRSARRSIRRAGVSDRIKLVKGDATHFDPDERFGVPALDRIVFSYALTIMPPWREALEEAARHLAPGGEIHIVDFGAADRWPRWMRAVMFRWLAKFHVYHRADLHTALRALAAKHNASLEFRSHYRRYTDLAVLRMPR